MWRDLLSAGRQWNVSGSGSDGGAYSGAMSVTTGAGLGTFKGEPKETPRLTVRVSRNGGPSAVTETIVFLDPGTGVVRYLTRNNGDCLEPRSTQEPVGAVAIGQAGVLFAGSMYSGCRALSINASETTASYSVEALDGATFFCFNMTIRGPLGGTSLESLCAELASASTFGSRARVATASNGVSVTMR